MKFLDKIQNLPERNKRIILWVGIILIGLALISFHGKNTLERWKSFNTGEVKEEVKFPDLGNEIKALKDAVNINLGENLDKIKEIQHTEENKK